MLFAGDQDMICNYVGMENMMQAMTWNGATGLGVSSLAYRFGVLAIGIGRSNADCGV